MARGSQLGLDVLVFRRGGEHPLLNMPNAICTPHLGYVELEGYELYFGQAFENINAFLKGES